MDYFIIISFVLLATLFLYRYSRNNKIVYFILLSILVILVCAMRKTLPNIINSDAYTYKQFYELAYNKSFKEYMLALGSIEYIFYGLFWICSQINLEYYTVKVIFYILMLMLMVFIKRESKMEENGYFDFLFFITNFVLSYCLMRNCMAYMMGWLAISLALNQKYAKAFVMAILTILVHSSGIIVFAFILFLIGITFIKKIGTLIFFMFLLYGGIIIVFPIFLKYLGGINEKIAYYNDVGTGSFAIATNVFRIIVFLLLLYKFKAKIRYREDLRYKNNILLCVFALSIIFLQLVNGIAYRFLAYFDIINIWVYGYLREAVYDRKISFGGKDAVPYILSGISIITFVTFINNSLLGYGLIPIKW